MGKIFEIGSSYFWGFIVILLIVSYSIRDIILAFKHKNDEKDDEGED